MRIAFPTPATFDRVRGGGERYVLNVARGLVRAANGDATVELIAPAAANTHQQLEEGISARGLLVHPASAGYGDGLSWDIVDAVAEADVVHVHQVFTRFGEAATLAARVLGRALCVTDHGGMTSAAGRRSGLLELAGAVVAYSRFGAAALGEATNVIIVEGATDASFFHPAEPAPAREHALFVGRIMAHKGIDLLVRACPPAIPVIVAGTAVDTRYFHDLQELARGRNVTFVLDTTDEQLRDLYQRAIAVVLPSVHEDMYGNAYLCPELMGLTLLEGMACGAPAICTPTGGLPEYVADGETGFVVDSEAVLGERLAQLAADVSLVERLGRAARAAVEQAWDITLAGRKLLEIYHRLLSR